MKLLTAMEAKELVNKTYSNDLDKVMEQIQEAAKKGKTKLHIYKPLNSVTISQLKDLGYDIPPMPSICSQKDDLFHTIHWA